jgi:hypothetical protein
MACTLPSHMHYMTITEYSDAIGLSRQAIYNRIEAAKLHTIESQTGKVFILVEDTEYEKIKGKHVDVS